jgi:hypothetical protein
MTTMRFMSLPLLLSLFVLTEKSVAFVAPRGPFINARLCNLRSGNSDVDYIQTLKMKILDISARTNRGEWASNVDVESALDAVTQLESLNPSFGDETEDNKFTMEGNWDLVFTDAQLFLSSPFFLTIREYFGTDSGAAKQLFDSHRAATNTGEIGVVQQVITSSSLTSNVNIRNGLIPGIPFSIRGVVVSTADLTIINRYSMKLSMKDSSVKDSNMPFGTILSAASIPVGALIKGIMGSLPECNLSTFYLDETLRITRNQDDSVFVYLRSPSDNK